MTRSTRRSPRTNGAKTQIMMAAAEVVIPLVLAAREDEDRPGDVTLRTSGASDGG